MKRVGNKYCFNMKTFMVGFYFFSTIIFSYWYNLQLKPYLFSLILSFCYFSYYLMKTNEKIWFFNKYIFLYYSLFLFCIISFLIGPKFEHDVQMILTFFKVVLSIFFISNLVRTKHTFLLILFVFSFSSWVIYYLNYDFILIAREETTRLYGFINSPNRLGYLLITVIWATLCLCFIFKSKWRFLILINLAPCLYMIFLTGSRKSLLSLAFLPFLLFIFHIRFLLKENKGKFFVLGLYCLITIVIVFSIVVSPQGKRFKKAVKQSAEILRDGKKAPINRVRYTVAAYNMFKESPFFGKGFNQFRHIGRQYHAPRGKYSHSTVLELIANSGIIGFILYFGSLFYLFFGIKQCINLEISEKEKIILRFGLILIVLMVILNIFAVMYIDKLYWPLLAAYAGYSKSLMLFKKVEA